MCVHISRGEYGQLAHTIGVAVFDRYRLLLVAVNGVDGEVAGREQLTFSLLHRWVLVPQLRQPGVPHLLSVGGEAGS